MERDSYDLLMEVLCDLMNTLVALEVNPYPDEERMDMCKDFVNKELDGRTQEI